jgi:serine/threonine protein kinase
MFQPLPQLSAAADVWSVSMVLYEMCVARLPYYEIEMVKLVPSIVAGVTNSDQGCGVDICVHVQDLLGA